MKLQNLLLIFIIIAIPVIIILSVYVEYQVDTAILRASYDSILLGATYDTMVAFQLNSTNNTYSTVSDSLVRDIEASINVFATSLASSLGVAGASQEGMMGYVPALLFTLYDGYYIYIPTNVVENGNEVTIDYELKPYVYYTKDYSENLKNSSSSLVINFSLDNYVVVYYYNASGGEYTSKAGYLEITTDKQNGTGIYVSGDDVYYNGIAIDKEETVIKNKYTYTTNTDGTISNFNTSKNSTTSTSAYDYYKEAYEFTNWYNSIIKEALGTTNKYYDILYIDKDNSALPNVSSEFNYEKVGVIEDIITTNLNQAMEMYSNKSSGDYAMPILTALDWEKILNNVCIISFIQGFPVGTSTYNDYVIVSSTENEQYISEEDIYYIGYGEDADGCYHRIGCPYLQGDTIVRICQIGIFKTNSNRSK